MKTKKVLITLLGLGLAIYGAFLFKKSFVDKGYPNESVEKEILLGNYVVMKGLENTKQNRDKYRNLSLEQIKKELGFDTPIPE